MVLIRQYMGDIDSYVFNTDQDADEAFLKEITDYGLQVKGYVEKDKIVRVDTADDKKGKESGWYFYSEFPSIADPSVLYGVGSYGSWKLGDKNSFNSRESSTLSSEEKAYYFAKVEKMKQDREAEQLKIYDEKSKYALQIWEESGEDTEHEYLIRKKVKAYDGVRISKNGDLVIPVCYDQQLTSLQFIKPDGSKKFLGGGRTKGCYFKIRGKELIVYIAEGYATAASIAEATGSAVYVCFNAGNIYEVASYVTKQHPDSKIIIAGDNDKFNDVNVGANKSTQAAEGLGIQSILLSFEAKYDDNRPTDFNDYANIYGIDKLKEFIEDREHLIVKEKPKLKLLNAKEILDMKLPPREYFLEPLIQQKSLSMIFASRGVGKTFFALNLAYAMATGTAFLKWQAPSPCKVLYIDGEMPLEALQERLKSIITNSSNKDIENLTFLAADFQESGIVNLSTENGQKLIEPFIINKDVVIFDNLATLFAATKQNDAESWLPIQQFALGLRRQGKAIIFIHHSGKDGNQRGTSAKEDALDMCIKLENPQDYQGQEGLHFELSFTKSRNLYGDNVEPLDIVYNGILWTYGKLENIRDKKILELKKQGLSQRNIAEVLGCNASTVCRTLKKINPVANCIPLEAATVQQKSKKKKSVANCTALEDARLQQDNVDTPIVLNEESSGQIKTDANKNCCIKDTVKV